MNPQVVCFGAAHVDIKYFAESNVILGSSNPVHSEMSLGGVARNVAESLSRLGSEVALVSRVANDVGGQQVLSDCQKLGIDISGVQIDSALRTANYTALIDPMGELVVAMADMAIYDSVCPTQIAQQCQRFLKSRIWLADSNLPASVLQVIADAIPKSTILALVAVSEAKIPRLKPCLWRADYIFANRAEWELLATDVLQQRTSAIVTNGLLGIDILQPDRETRLPVERHLAKDVTGAGDALCAGTLFGLMQNQSLVDAVSFGRTLAQAAIATSKSVFEGKLNESIVGYSP